MTTQRITLISLLFLTCLLQACAGARPLPRSALDENQQKVILDKVEAYNQSLQKVGSAKAFAKVKLKVRGYKSNFDEVIKIAFPFNFYFETLDDLANTRFVLSSDGSTLFWQDYGRKEYYEGEFQAEKLRKFLPLAASLEETLGYFIGKIPALDFHQAQVSKIAEGPQYAIPIPGGEIIWDDSQNAIVSLAFGKEGARVGFAYEGANFRRQKLSPGKDLEVLLPARVKLRDKKTKNEIEILYQDSELAVGNFAFPGPLSWDPLLGAKKIHELP